MDDDKLLFFLQFLVPVANNFRAVLFLGDFRKIVPLPRMAMSAHRLASSGDMLSKIVDALRLELAVEARFPSLAARGRRKHTDHRCRSGSFMYKPLLGWGGTVSLPRSWAAWGVSLRFCTFAFSCWFGVSLHAFCMLNLVTSVLPSPIPAHLGALRFRDTAHSALPPAIFPACYFLGVLAS